MPYSIADFRRTFPADQSSGGGSPGAYGGVDRVALSKVGIAAILGLVGTVLSLLVLLFTNATSLLGVTTAGSGTSLSFDLSELYLLVALGGVGLILTLLELWFYRDAFRALARQDPRFSTPAKLAWAAIVALMIIFLVAIVLFGNIYQAITCAGAGNAITSSCLNVGDFLLFVGILLIAAIVFLIGYIGLLVGIWRLGTRYGEGMFKVGAILVIIPYLNAVGLILILIAARSARGKNRGFASHQQFG